MSLKAATEAGIYHAEYIEFVMLDGSKRVPCRVSKEALDDVEGGNPTPKERMERFNRYRTRIEKTAARNYESGEPQPCVTSAQLGRAR